MSLCIVVSIDWHYTQGAKAISTPIIVSDACNMVYFAYIIETLKLCTLALLVWLGKLWATIVKLFNTHDFSAMTISITFILQWVAWNESSLLL